MPIDTLVRLMCVSTTGRSFLDNVLWVPFALMVEGKKHAQVSCVLALCIRFNRPFCDDGIFMAKRKKPERYPIIGRELFAPIGHVGTANRAT